MYSKDGAISETSFIEVPEKKSRFKITLEPVVFLTLFSWNLTTTVVQDQIVYKVCTVELGYNSSDCRDLSLRNQTDGVDLEQQVQPLAANMIMVKNLTEAILSIFFTLFIGPWSDKYGRKPVLVSTTTGFLLTYFSLTILHLLKVSLSAWVYVLAFGFVAMVGGHVTLFVAIYCYVTDTSTEENRTFNLGVLEAVLCSGVVVGSILSSYIYSWYGPGTVMSVATVATLVALLWTIFVVDESRATNFPFKRKLREVFRTEHIRDLIVVCLKRRPGVDRGVLWTVMLALGFSIFVLQGTECVLFLFVRERFHWNVRSYTLYSAIATICLIATNLVAMFAKRISSCVSDEALSVLSFVSAFISSVTVALASAGWHMYLAVGISSLMGIAKPMCRSILATISKRTESDGNEIGKIFSLTAALEAIMPVLSVPLYSYVYKSTLTVLPGAFNWISAAIWGLFVIFLTAAFRRQSVHLRRASYQELY